MKNWKYKSMFALFITVCFVLSACQEKVRENKPEIEVAESILVDYYDAAMEKNVEKAMELVFFNDENDELRGMQRSALEKYPFERYEINGFTQIKEELYKADLNIYHYDEVASGRENLNVINYVQRINGKWYVVLNEENLVS